MKERIILFLIFCIAIFFRFNNLNWDNNFHLHPDERFLTMVGTASKIPSNILDYFNQKTSTLNPNNIGYQFFVYGTFPLTVNKILAYLVDMDNYNGLTILGRFLSALADLTVVYFVYKVAEILQGKNKNVKYWAAFFYAISVLPIQLSHFYAVDSFLNMFMFGSFYHILRIVIPSPSTTLRVNSARDLAKDFSLSVRNDIMLSAIFFGLALSCKVTAIFILPLNLLLLTKTFFVQRQSFFKALTFIVFYLLISYVAVRIANPYYFENPSFFNPEISKIFINSVQSLKSLTIKNMNSYYPPMVQWLSKDSMTFSLTNNSIFGLGIVQTLMVLSGGLFLTAQGIKKILNRALHKDKNLLILLIMFLWTVSFFTYQSLQTNPTLRYFVLIYPFFAIFAAYGTNNLLIIIKNITKSCLILNTYYLILLLLFFIWPLMFSSIYITKNSRVTASEWIYKNIPNNSLILSEYWDDALPMPMIDNYGKQFRGEALTVFDPDTTDKWIKINQQLKSADYYILSSNRAWGSIPLVPKKYPQGSKFYQDLFAEKLGYKKIKEFTSYPSLRWLGIPIDFPDQWSDEAFTVYDHPKVMIFQNKTHD